MRVAIEHQLGQGEAMRRVDQGTTQLLASASGAGVEIRNLQKSWEHNTLTFSFTGKMGPFTAPVRGTTTVTEHVLIIDVDLGIVEKLMPEEKIRGDIEAGARKMLEDNSAA